MGSPNNAFLTMVKMISPKENRQNSTPIKAAKARGAVEKEVIPSREYINSFQKDHLVMICIVNYLFMLDLNIHIKHKNLKFTL